MAEAPPYAPNVVNQTVDYGGITWKGQPGGGWVAQGWTGGGGGSASSIIANSVQKIAPYAEFSWKDIDKAQAKASAEAEFGPYYSEKLADYTTGIERDMSRSTEDLSRTLSYLLGGKEYYEGSARRILDLAIRKSNEGYAGQGLFFSGARERDKKLLEEETGYNMAENTRQYEYNTSGAQLGNKRTQEDLTLNKQITTRDIGREKDYAIEQNILQQKSEKLQEYTTKRTAYYDAAGYYG